MNWKRWAVLAFVLCALLFVAAPFVASASSPWMQVKFLRVLVDVIIDDDATIAGDVAISGDTTAAGITASGTVQGEQVTSTDDASVTDDLTVGGWAILTPQADVGCTMNGWLTPMGTVQPITAASSVSIAGIVTETLTNGSWLRLINTGSYTVTITDTATCSVTLGGNWVGATGDVLDLHKIEGVWYEVSRMDASS